jgi:hypothetical protein
LKIFFRTFGGDPLNSTAGKIAKGAIHLDHTFKTFNLKTVGDKNTKKEMWDVMNILDS